jgi:hypothetical protein
MANTDLAVRIATIFDSSGLKKADKSLGGFDKNLKKLAKTLGTALSVSTVVAFGKASVKAFLEEEKSAALLANTMKNLGIAFAVPQMETFISQLSKTAGVADDVLRPAMQKLLSQTGDYYKSQELLTQAIEISRGSGIELSTVVSDLSAAYVGNTKGLKKYNLGLTQAQLKTMSFTDVQKKLTNQFKGSNAAYLETYAGKMEVLKTAAGEAQETIGKGLVDALSLLAGDTSIQGVADQMQELADYTSDVIVGFATLTATIKNALPAGVELNFTTFMPPQVKEALRYLDYFAKIGEKSKNSQMENPSIVMFKADMANLRLQMEAAVFKKKELDLTKKKIAEDKKAALAKKQATLFDLEKIGLVAALQGKITEEERLRLNLQLALLTGNDALAAKLSAELAKSIDSTGKLAKDLTTLPDAKNPFAAWSSFLDEIIAKARLAASFGAIGGSTARGESFATLTPTVQSLVAGGGGGAGSSAAGDVYITVNGSVLSEQDLVLAVQNGLNYNSLAGKKSDIGRIAGMFG